MKNERAFRPDRVMSYFRAEWLPFTFVTVSGLLYNIELIASPWFEGQLAECLTDILNKKATAEKMAVLEAAYFAVTLAVQTARFVKRFFVKRFANNINRRMKSILYADLVRESRASLESEGVGELMTKAVSDVDDCVEGMRKFTTEVFDTGVALIGYAVMLFTYDVRLALLSLIFTPVSYIRAELMKKPVQRAGANYKNAAGNLSAATLDRARNAVTYRIYGCEDVRAERYEETLNNLSFSYGGVTVFSGLSLTAHIRRYYRSDRPGCLRKIHIRADISDITDRERRFCIGCVEQHFSRVPGTVLEQITLGDRRITAEMAENAARLAGIDGAIAKLPDGYNTVCTEGMFSQGEWQLLSIARAAAANLAVLLLDEITANLDAATEARVLAALHRAAEGHTVISISHRVYKNSGGRAVEIKAEEA